MRTLVYRGPGRKAFREVPDPEIITITAGLVDTSSIPTLMRLLTAGQIDARRFVTHHFGLEEFDEAYDVFAAAPSTYALKMVLSR